MEPDCYLVQILHYLNPHLIWIKVQNRSSDEHSLEQIGVYGVLPVDMELDYDSEEVTLKRCETWQPAAAMVMKKVLMEATEVKFQPTYIDRRSSIFDTNIHKYGEIFIRKADGRFRKMSSYLEKSDFALYDEAAFHQELSSGRILTKLTKNTIDEVMKEIKNHLSDDESEVSLRKQTTVYQAGKKLEALTTNNLDKHNRMYKKMMSRGDILNILDRKFKDLELCKDIDEVSVGRAVGRIQLKDNQKPIGEVTVSDQKTKSNDTNDVNSVKVSKEYDSFTETDDIKASKDQKKGTEDVIDEVSMAMNDERNAFKRVEEQNYPQQQKKPKTPKTKLPVYDVLTEKRVAYSPPGVNRATLAYKVVPIRQEILGVPKVDQEEVEIFDLNDDMFGKVDSNINIKITNKKVLEKYDNNHENYGSSSEQDSNDLTLEPKEMKVKDITIESSSEINNTLKSRMLQRKLKLHKEKIREHGSESSVSNTTSKHTSSRGDSKEKEDSDVDVSETIEKYKAENIAHVTKTQNDRKFQLSRKKNNVNPFKNVDPNLSVFVDKLVTPVLMVHTKNNARVEPKSQLSEIPFSTNIHNALRNMNIQRPMTMQSVSWVSVLRGNSVFLISPQGSGKTMGYLPSVCRLISDSDNDIVNSVGPTCVIVCATARSVSEVEQKCRMLLTTTDKIFSCYAGMDMVNITTSLLNGCDLFICTPCVLTRLLLQTDFGLDLRRLTMLVLDDCERLDEVYKNEIKVVLLKIKEMLKIRANKVAQVQYVLASRVWCDFMEPLAKKTPNTVVCIGAFQECLLYSKADTTVDFVKTENKNAKVLEFLEKNNKNKKTVIVCSEDNEVDVLEKILKKMKCIVFACNRKMTVEDLRGLNKAWDESVDPVTGPILVCCDGNLSHMNITDAHYLIHYSMPELFSMFCKRFSVLNDNYPSIFKTENESVSINIILEDNNTEQLPKICNFVKRCTKNFPSMLDEICQEILNRKDLLKASDHVPICGNLLALGECPDFWYCKERHTSSVVHDEPKQWMPTEGIITFKILHYQTAVLYSARLLSNIKKGGIKKYPQTYSTLSLKMGMFFSQDSNRKLHGVPKVGDICAVSVKENFFMRCQVVNILNTYKTGNPNHVLVKLIDEEKLETTRDIYLYHLPNELRELETHVIQVRLAGLLPKDRDITFSDLALNQLKKSVENNDNLYMRGKVILNVGNIIFVDNVDVCQDLSSMNEVVVKHNFKELLEPHSVAFPEHINKLKSCLPNANAGTTDLEELEEIEEIKPIKEIPKAQWAHLNREDLSLVFFTSALDPGTFFVRLTKFEDTMDALCKDIDKYTEENPDPLKYVKENDIVLAKFPDDECYERARVDVVVGNKAKCFFVDHGDWREIPLNHLIQIPDKFITQIPFQAIECRLIGIQPVGDHWTDFSTNWLCDRCDPEDLKKLYVQYFSSDKAKYTGGTKYAVALIDTSGDNDVVYNNLMIDLNLAAPDDAEIDILNNMNLMKSTDDWETPNVEINDDKDWEIPQRNATSNRVSGQPIRSMPLLAEDDDSDDDRWSFNMPYEFMNTYKCNNAQQTSDVSTTAKAVIKSADSFGVSDVKNSNGSAMSEYEVIAPLKIKELDSDDFSTESQTTKSESLLQEVNVSRKPKLLWTQNKSMVTIKIMLIGVEKYEINILERSIAFSANAYDTLYSFELELYGLVEKHKCIHSNKGQYILVKLVKRMHKNWLSLTKGKSITKWIVYDVDSIDTSSDEEVVQDNNMAEILRRYDKDDSESDDQFCDDANI